MADDNNDVVDAAAVVATVDVFVAVVATFVAVDVNVVVNVKVAVVDVAV